MTDGAELLAEIEILGNRLETARASIRNRFLGQEDVVDLTLATLLCGGHALLVGLPGLGKTRLVETLATVMGLDANRVQFTPDLMPADILGSEVLETSSDGSRAFRFIEGPVFCQLLMADEINRASPRTQSALLQAMQEHQVSVAGSARPLGAPFHVLATQNPLEQEGTYPPARSAVRSVFAANRCSLSNSHRRARHFDCNNRHTRCPSRARFQRHRFARSPKAAAADASRRWRH